MESMSEEESNEEVPMGNNSEATLPKDARLIAELYYPDNWDDADTSNEIDEKMDELAQALKDDQNALAYVVVNRDTNGNEEEPFEFETWREQLVGKIGSERLRIIKGDEGAPDFAFYVGPKG